jgi:hypothetical protein
MVPWTPPSGNTSIFWQPSRKKINSSDVQVIFQRQSHGSSHHHTVPWYADHILHYIASHTVILKSWNYTALHALYAKGDLDDSRRSIASFTQVDKLYYTTSTSLSSRVNFCFLCIPFWQNEATNQLYSVSLS